MKTKPKKMRTCGECLYFGRNPFCYIQDRLVMEETDACKENFEPYQKGIAEVKGKIIAALREEEND